MGLITSDEVVLAGLKWGVVNPNGNYLVTGQQFWTMTPSRFNSTDGQAHVMRVYSTGIVSSSHVYNAAPDARPVINISGDVLITEGDGSSESPFKLSLE